MAAQWQEGLKGARKGPLVLPAPGLGWGLNCEQVQGEGVPRPRWKDRAKVSFRERGSYGSIHHASLTQASPKQPHSPILSLRGDPRVAAPSKDTGCSQEHVHRVEVPDASSTDGSTDSLGQGPP